MSSSTPPFHLARLLVGVDDDPRTDPAVSRAVELARRSGCEVRLIHAVTVPRPHWWQADRAGFLKRETEAVASARRAMVRRLSSVLESAGWEGTADGILRVAPGAPARVLCEGAVDSSADLLVVGPHAKRGLIDFGSTLRGLFARSPCPVWVQLGEPTPIERIVAPIDLAEESPATLDVARAVADLLGAAVTVVHCFAGPDFAYETDEPGPGPTYTVDALREESRERLHAMVDAFDWKGVDHDTRFVEADPIEGILDLHTQGDLLVIGTHGAGAFSTAVLGGTAYGVLREAHTPVLAVRHAKQPESGSEG